MKKTDELLLQLREAASGEPYSEGITEILHANKCSGFADHPLSLNTPVVDVLTTALIHQRFVSGKHIFDSLKKRNIPYSVVKGAVLSQRIYGKVTARISGDVDILIPRKYIDTVKYCFQESGFVQGRIVEDRIIPYSRQEIIFQTSQSHQIAPFVCATGNMLCPFVNYDINIDLFWGESNRRTDMDIFLNNSQSLQIGDIEVQTLPPEKEFIALCLHHFKDWNSIYLIAERGVPLTHFFDIYGYLLVQHPDITLLRQLCTQYKATEYVFFCIWYTYTLFEKAELIPYMDALRTPEGEALTNHYGLEENYRRRWTIPLADRVFDNTFLTRFAQTLTERDRNIIETNRAMM